MSDPKRVGEMVAPILKRCAALSGLNDIINVIEQSCDRKEFIMMARLHGLVTDEETELLLQVYQLETA